MKYTKIILALSLLLCLLLPVIGEEDAPVPETNLLPAVGAAALLLAAAIAFLLLRKKKGKGSF